MSQWRNRQPISAPTFDDAVPPPGYIPGYGRGAIGFGTRATSGVVPGYIYTKEDDEADSIFEKIDARMKSRKRKKNMEKEKNKKQSCGHTYLGFCCLFCTEYIRQSIRKKYDRTNLWNFYNINFIYLMFYYG